jgi:hypothetical protein
MACRRIERSPGAWRPRSASTPAACRAPRGTIVASSDGRTRQHVHRPLCSDSGGVSAGTAVSRERRTRPRRVLLIERRVEARELRMMLSAGPVVYDAADGVRGLELLNVFVRRRDHRRRLPGWTVTGRQACSRGAARPRHAARSPPAALTVPVDHAAIGLRPSPDDAVDLVGSPSCSMKAPRDRRGLFTCEQTGIGRRDMLRSCHPRRLLASD